MAYPVDMILAALVAVYVVDVSGFTQSWRALLARAIGVRRDALRPLPPFDCGTCMAFWTAVAWSLATGTFSVQSAAIAAACSLLAKPAGILMTTIREGLATLLNIPTRWMN